MRYVMRQSRDGAVEILETTAPGDEGGFRDWLRRPDWAGTLTWFMRTMAWVWIAKGLYNWAVILGLWARFGDFAMLPRALQGSMAVFAAVDFIAAVGLWLAAAWGGSLWLLCAVGEAATPVLGSTGSYVNNFAAALDVALVATYFVLKWRVSTQRTRGPSANR